MPRRARGSGRRASRGQATTYGSTASSSSPASISPSTRTFSIRAIGGIRPAAEPARGRADHHRSGGTGVLYNAAGQAIGTARRVDGDQGRGVRGRGRSRLIFGALTGVAAVRGPGRRPHEPASSRSGRPGRARRERDATIAMSNAPPAIPSNTSPSFSPHLRPMLCSDRRLAGKQIACAVQAGSGRTSRTSTDLDALILALGPSECTRLHTDCPLSSEFQTAFDLRQ